MLKTDKVIYTAESNTIDSLSDPFAAEEIGAVYEHKGTRVSVMTTTYRPDTPREFTCTDVHLMGEQEMSCNRFSDFVAVTIGPVTLYLRSGDEVRLAEVLKEES